MCVLHIVAGDTVWQLFLEGVWSSLEGALLNFFIGLLPLYASNMPGHSACTPLDGQRPAKCETDSLDSKKSGTRSKNPRLLKKPFHLIEECLEKVIFLAPFFFVSKIIAYDHGYV